MPESEKLCLTSRMCVVIIRKLFRGVAQMVARMVRDHEAASSSLATPTKIKLGLQKQTEFYFVKKYKSRWALPPRAPPLLYRIKKAPTIVGAFLLERATRLELATSTLARWRSTG